MVKYDLSVAHPVMYKNRFKTQPKKTEIKFGDYGLAFVQQGRFEIKYIFMLRRMLKKLRIKKHKKRRRMWFKSRFIWFFLFPNFIISKKSKNSRMGKGKGELQRWTIRVKQGLVFLEFRGFSIRKIKALNARLQKNLQIKISTVFPSFWYYSTLNSFSNQRLYSSDRFLL